MPAKPLETACFHFAVRIAKLAQKLQDERRDLALSSEVLKSGTNIGFLVSEAELKKDSEEYTNMIEAALKEAKRTHYWLSIIEGTGWLPETLAFGLKSDCDKLIERLQMAKSGVNT